MKNKITPTRNERVMTADEFIVSKTDAKGRLTYCNRIFIDYAGYDESELLGQQHHVVRHPEMPRAVFHLLWSTLKSGNEFFGYVKNMSKDGSFYWVFANVTPSYSNSGNNIKDISGYFSVRRKPDAEKLRIIDSLYKQMLLAEQAAGTSGAIAAGTKVLMDVVNQTGKDYREFILSI